MRPPRSRKLLVLSALAGSLFVLFVVRKIYHKDGLPEIDPAWIAYLEKVEATELKHAAQGDRLVQKVHFVDSEYTTEIGDLVEKNVSSSNETRSIRRKKRLVHVSYVHYLDTKDKQTVENFKFFIDFAYSPCDQQVFFTITLNQDDVSKNPREYLRSLLGLNVYEKLSRCLITANNIALNSKIKQNTQIIIRKNRPGSDLCAQVEFLRSEFWLSNEKLFKYFFFINSSVRGPFLPTYYFKRWYDNHFYNTV
jgi:hypothetical protein